MTISEKEEQLFKKWEKRRESFVPDGAVSEQDYLKSCPKIAFILKETNYPGDDFDLRQFLRDGACERWQTWNNVARWVHGIRSLPSDAIGPISKKKGRVFRREMLKGIVAMNLKKSPGGSSTDDACLERAAREDAECIQEQYAIYDPDITICGGVGELFRQVVHPKMRWEQTTRGVRWYWRNPDRCVVAFCHPAARLSTVGLLGGLLDAIKEIKQKQE